MHDFLKTCHIFKNKNYEFVRPSSFVTFSKLEEEVEALASGSETVGRKLGSPAHCSEGEVRYFVTAFAIVDLRTGSSSFEGNSTSCY